MAKIIKADEAPDGTIVVIYPGGDFQVTGRGFKTDDPDQIAAAQVVPYLSIEADEPKVERAAEQAEANAARERGEYAAAEKARAEKDPMDPAPDKSIAAQPTTEETEERN